MSDEQQQRPRSSWSRGRRAVEVLSCQKFSRQVFIIIISTYNYLIIILRNCFYIYIIKQHDLSCIYTCATVDGKLYSRAVFFYCGAE